MSAQHPQSIEEKNAQQWAWSLDYDIGALVGMALVTKQTARSLQEYANKAHARYKEIQQSADSVKMRHEALRQRIMEEL